MHIEPGVVEGAKIYLSYGTAIVAAGATVKVAADFVRENGLGALVLRSVLAALMVFCFFEVLWHYPAGVSEVHLILGTTIFLFFGLAPAAIGLAGGLLLQGLFFAPYDLPQYAINLTTLLAPLFVMGALAKRIIPAATAYVDLSYAQTLKLSAAYQGGIVAWVAFWALYGHGFGAGNLAEIAAFGGSYLLVVIVEPLIDLAVLAGAKALHALKGSRVFEKRLYAANAG
ncbi:MAG: energy-coupling factor ABC transporter permease [Rhodocyclaceae bacterium]